jgi:CubicO group peptidase (beta-lactamase class C family)
VREIDSEVRGARVQGEVAESFRAVAEAFERNFAENGEVGGSLCIRLGGETVVDLWGGVADRDTGRSWQRDTLTPVFSCTKGATALCAHVLASRGKLDVDAFVADYWPEFATAGKEHATVRMMLDHTVGLPALRTPVKADGCCDWDYMTGLLAAEEPFWKPGTRGGYHMLNFGWTVGELVRRVSGRSVGAFLNDEIARPLGVEFWIGLPEEHETRVAPIIPFAPSNSDEIGDFGQAILADRKSIQMLSLYNTGGFDPSRRPCRAAEIPGAGGISNARGLAGIYSPFAQGGNEGGKTFVDRDTLARMAEVSAASNEDATLLIPTRFALGFMKSMDNRKRARGQRDSVIFGAQAFGHAGLGGSLGFADPETRMSFGYAMNRHGNGILLNERGQSLVDACYQALGYTSNSSGAWRR